MESVSKMSDEGNKKVIWKIADTLDRDSLIPPGSDMIIIVFDDEIGTMDYLSSLPNRVMDLQLLNLLTKAVKQKIEESN